MVYFRGRTTLYIAMVAVLLSYRARMITTVIYVIIIILWASSCILLYMNMSCKIIQAGIICNNPHLAAHYLLHPWCVAGSIKLLHPWGNQSWLIHYIHLNQMSNYCAVVLKMWSVSYVAVRKSSSIHHYTLPEHTCLLHHIVLIDYWWHTENEDFALWFLQPCYYVWPFDFSFKESTLSVKLDESFTHQVKWLDFK